VSKRTYSEVKHDDKFHETLTKFWDKIQPHMLHVGLAAGGVLVLALGWILVAQSGTATQNKPWAERAAIADKEIGIEERLEDYAALAKAYQGQPVAAMTQIEIAQGYFGLGNQKSLPPLMEDEKPADAATRKTEAKQAFQKAAAAAEQVIADHPDYSLVELAAFEAGKARFALEEYDLALPHFTAAAASKVLYLSAIAQWHAARCHQALGDVDAARAAYTRVMDNQHADFLAAQAEFDLARLDEKPVRETK